MYLYKQKQNICCIVGVMFGLTGERWDWRASGRNDGVCLYIHICKHIKIEIIDTCICMCIYIYIYVYVCVHLHITCTHLDTFSWRSTQIDRSPKQGNDLSGMKSKICSHRRTQMNRRPEQGKYLSELNTIVSLHKRKHSTSTQKRQRRFCIEIQDFSHRYFSNADL